MATKKNTAEVVDEVIDAEAVEKAEDATGQDVDAFIARKIKVINELDNPAKARRAARRVLANKRKAGK